MGVISGPKTLFNFRVLQCVLLLQSLSVCFLFSLLVRVTHMVTLQLFTMFKKKHTHPQPLPPLSCAGRTTLEHSSCLVRTVNTCAATCWWITYVHADMSLSISSWVRGESCFPFNHLSDLFARDGSCGWGRCSQ